MRQKRWGRIFTYIICFTAVLSFFVPFFPVQAQELQVSQPVRVGYYNLGDYYVVAEDGSLDSYDVAFLERVGEYTGLRFEYVYCETWDKAIELLERHEIDLVGTMQWTQQREDAYEICNASYGYAVAELAALPEKGYVYEEYEQLNGATIGCVGSYVILDYLQGLMEEYDIQAEIVTYEDQQTLDYALDSGEIDVIAANAHAMHESWDIIGKFAYEPFYFASWKGNTELIKDISQAIVEINIYQESFDDKLMQEYFSRVVNSPYNKEELECIAAEETYTIYLDTYARPLAWYDEAEGKMQGILVDICSSLEEKTGLHFEIRPRKEIADGAVEYTTEYYSFLDSGSVVYNSQEGKTQSILSEEFMFYHRAGEYYDYREEAPYKVAILKKRQDFAEYLQEIYPNYEFVEYETPKECMDHLQQQDVDLVFLSSYVANSVIITEDIDEIVSIPTTAITLEMGLEFCDENAEVLASIVNKGYILIEADEINEIRLKYFAGIVPNPTVTYLIKQHPAGTVAIVMIFFLLLGVSISMIVYARIIGEKNQRIIEANQGKMDFFSRMSHDMRTPMNGILGMARLSKGENDPEVLRHNMDMVEESGTYMLSLINDTLDLQRLEAGKMTLQPEIVNSRIFMDSVFAMVRTTAQQKNITFKTTVKNMDLDNYVRVDQVRLKQIFSNLLSNAIKFTPEGGCVEFISETTGVEGGLEHDRFVVSDTGIGISRDFIENDLFLPYSQENNSTTRQYAGSGLGLTITKNLVELMGGTITVESEVGEGSRFTVCLDLEIIDEKEVQQSKSKESRLMAQAESRIQGKKILLCEDHHLNAEIAKRILEKAGAVVVWAEDGEKGVKTFLDSKFYEFDGILMDIRMPNMDGIEATKTIRAMERPDAKEICIIAMTANAYQEDVSRTLEAGMNAHLAKPIEPKTLYETLGCYIGS